MNRNRATVLMLVTAGLIAGITQTAKADEWDQKTIFTFSAPVEIPGQVLGAGTYVFKLADSSGDRNIVQVFNKDEDHLYGTFLAVPDERLKRAGKPIITFDERPSDSPEAVKAWFYPGETYGHQFVYPKRIILRFRRCPLNSPKTLQNLPPPSQNLTWSPWRRRP